MANATNLLLEQVEVQNGSTKILLYRISRKETKTVMQNNDMVDVTEEKDHMCMCDYCIHKYYCFVAGKKKEYCGNYTEERWIHGRE